MDQATYNELRRMGVAHEDIDLYDLDAEVMRFSEYDLGDPDGGEEDEDPKDYDEPQAARRLGYASFGEMTEEDDGGLDGALEAAAYAQLLAERRHGASLEALSLAERTSLLEEGVREMGYRGAYTFDDASADDEEEYADDDGEEDDDTMLEPDDDGSDAAVKFARRMALRQGKRLDNMTYSEKAQLLRAAAERVKYRGDIAGA